VSRVQISNRALADLDVVWDFIAEDNIRAADETVQKIRDRCLSYANQPELGERRPEVGSDLRSFSGGRYIIYYHATSEGIEVVRVLHSARDVDRQF
jgi:toxin ParE1/3/4